MERTEDKPLTLYPLSIEKYLLSAYVASTFQGIRDVVVNKNMIPALTEYTV